MISVVSGRVFQRGNQKKRTPLRRVRKGPRLLRPHRPLQLHLSLRRVRPRFRHLCLRRVGVVKMEEEMSLDVIRDRGREMTSWLGGLVTWHVYDEGSD